MRTQQKYNKDKDTEGKRGQGTHSQNGLPIAKVEHSMSPDTLTPVGADGAGGADMASSSAGCGIPHPNPAFCAHVSWETSHAVAAADRDAMALRDYDSGLRELESAMQGNAMCVEQWRALQCAAKFPKCHPQMPVQYVCQSLCERFVDACHAPDSKLCSNVSLYSAKAPCTDYAEPIPDLLQQPYLHAALIREHSSRSDLLNPVTGVPLLIALTGVCESELSQAPHVFDDCFQAAWVSPCITAAAYDCVDTCESELSHTPHVF